ncbi:MAG TPA: hypothetical protein VHG51_05920 [Longimicrobiaceae bacterium]|nr:hypothetical protein [Longimicrobiaceae bacterium]
MKFPKYAAAAALLVPAFATTAAAQTATQTVSYEVQAINQLSVSGSPSLVISSAPAGSAPTSATASGSYAVTTNQTGKKITAELDNDLPSGVTLSVTLAAPTGAISVDGVSLSTTPASVVTGIGTVNESGLSVSYELAATVAAGVVPASSRTVLFTITDGV